MFSFRVSGKNALGNQGKGRIKSCACVVSSLDKGMPVKQLLCSAMSVEKVRLIYSTIKNII